MSEQLYLGFLGSLVAGGYVYTFLCSQKAVHRDEFNDVKEKIDAIYEHLIGKALSNEVKK